MFQIVLRVLFRIGSAVFFAMLACVGTRMLVHWLWGRRSDGLYGTERFRKQLEEEKELDGELLVFCTLCLLPAWFLVLLACFVFGA